MLPVLAVKYVTTIFLVLEICIPSLVNGIIRMTPEVNEVMVGQSANFNCSTSVYDKNVDWYFYAVGATGLDRKFIYAFGKLYKPYDNKVRIDNSSTGVWNLVIHNVTLEDAGRYVCQDDGGIGEQKTAQMVVLATYPSCNGTNAVVGPNSCGIEPEELTLSCSVTYNGNIHPVVQWKSSRKNESLVQHVTVQNIQNIVTYNLAMKADPQWSGSFFYCETTRSTLLKYNCTSDVINVQYLLSDNATIHSNVQDELKCSANKSNDLVCNYKWFQGRDSITKSTNQSLTPSDSGKYICNATCAVKSTNCTVRVVTAYVSDKDSTQPWVIIIGVLCVALAIVLVVIVVCVVKKVCD